MLSAVIFTDEKLILMYGTYSKNHPKIKKQLAVDYPKDVYVNGEIIDTEGLGRFIASELKKEKMKGTGLLFGIQNAQINVIDISVPYVKGKIMQAVNVKLSERFIGITEENYISYKMNKVEGNLCYGMATIVPTKILDKYYELSMKIGLPLKAIDYLGNIFYKSLHLEASDLAKHTFVVAESDANELFVHLYHEGVLKNTRGEHNNSIFIQDEPVMDDFVFQNRLSFTDEDIQDTTNAYQEACQGIEDLYAVRSTMEIFFQRYRNEQSDDVSQDDKESILKSFDTELIEVRNLCQKSLDFEEQFQKNTQKMMHELLMRIQKLNSEVKQATFLQSSFASGIFEILSTVKTKVQEIVEIFDRYLLNDVDQKKQERRAIIQNICRITNRTVVMADRSQEYPEIDTIYVQGLFLDQNEKKLIEQNLSKFYTIEVRNYESCISDSTNPYMGIFYNDYQYFRDLDLALAMEKNDKINRNNYDNIILGIGGTMVFGVICIFGLWGYTQYDIYRMNSQIAENQIFIENNETINQIVTNEQSLRLKIEEIENFQKYFTLANVDMDEIHNQLQNINQSVEVSELSIDSNFYVKMKLRADLLEQISSYMESLIKEGYASPSYDSVILKDGKFEVSAQFRYTPK